MQVVEQRNEAHPIFGYFVIAGRTIDEGIRRVPRSFEPRPPQPARPAFNRSLEDAPRASAMADEAAMNVRRETESMDCIRSIITSRVGTVSYDD
jgi:hypothetical protein